MFGGASLGGHDLSVIRPLPHIADDIDIHEFQQKIMGTKVGGGLVRHTSPSSSGRTAWMAAGLRHTVGILTLRPTITQDHPRLLKAILKDPEFSHVYFDISWGCAVRPTAYWRTTGKSGLRRNVLAIVSDLCRS